ncbi:MAG: argininosuccinate lyase [Candidatus Hydrogenedentes bacterium]|nr:argininosuccinate lyase [Candidatus Hydrogenedentota bacterium]
MAEKLWAGRFSGISDPIAETYTESVSFDSWLAPYDIMGSIAHVRMLARCGIITEAESCRIIDGLESINRDICDGTFKFRPELEDVHTNIEVALTERIGPSGGKLHTARSRNDQVALDMHLYVRDAVDETRELLRSIQKTIKELAEQHVETVMPGMTHLQHAQPVSFAHHIMAYFWMFERDHQRFSDLRRRVNVMPLGAGALAGTPFPIDRQFVAELLDFDSVSENSIDAVSDRDFVIEFCSVAAISMMHISRLAEELVMWSSDEFGFISIDERYATGSSIMPQKRNPDVAEIARGKTGRAYGALMNLLTIMKGLPLAYDRDMQEDKPPLFDAADTLVATLYVVNGMLATIEVRTERQPFPDEIIG